MAEIILLSAILCLVVLLNYQIWKMLPPPPPATPTTWSPLPQFGVSSPLPQFGVSHTALRIQDPSQ